MDGQRECLDGQICIGVRMYKWLNGQTDKHKDACLDASEGQTEK